MPRRSIQERCPADDFEEHEAPPTTSRHLPPKSRRRMLIRQRYIQRVSQNDATEERPSRRRTVPTKSLETDDSTMTTMSESTVSWKQLQGEARSLSSHSPLHQPMDDNDNTANNLMDNDLSELYSTNGRRKNGMNQDSHRRQHDDFSISSDNSIRDRYAAIHNGSNSKSKSNDNGEDSPEDPFCSMRACARDYAEEGCYRNLCPKFQSHEKDESAENQNDTITKGQHEKKAPQNKRFNTESGDSDEWDFNVVVERRPNNEADTTPMMPVEDTIVERGMIVEWPSNELANSLGASFLVTPVETENFVMSTTSIVLREFLDMNLSPSTRYSRLQKALVLNNPLQHRRQASGKQGNSQATIQLPKSRVQLLQQALHRGNKSATDAQNQKSESTIGEAHNTIEKQQSGGSSLKDRGGHEVSIRASSDTPIDSDTTSGESRESEFLSGYIPPIFVQKFEMDLEETTDLAPSFIYAHLKDDNKHNDDGLGEEFAKLHLVEQQIAAELKQIDDEARAGGSNDESGKDKQQAMDAVYNAILAMSSDYTNSDDDSSLEISESTFDVQETRNAVFNAIERLQGQFSAEDQRIQESLEQVQQKILNDLSQIGSASTPNSSSHENSIESETTLMLEIPVTSSTVSEMSCDVQSKHLDVAHSTDSQKDWHAVLEECESIPMQKSSSLESSEIQSSSKISHSNAERSPDMTDYPSLMDTSASTDSTQDCISGHDRYQKTTGLDDEYHKDTSSEAGDLFQSSDETTSKSDTFTKRTRASIWGALLGAQKRSNSQSNTNSLQNVNDWSQHDSGHKAKGDLDEVEQGRRTPRKSSLLIGSTSRAAHQEEPDSSIERQEKLEGDKLGGRGRYSYPAPVSEVYFDDLPNVVSDLPFASGGVCSQVAHLALNPRLQSEAIDEYDNHVKSPGANKPIWSMTPNLRSFSANSQERTPSEGWSLSPNLTPSASEASKDGEKVTKNEESSSENELDLKQSITEDSKLLQYWHGIMNNKKQSNMNANKHAPFVAASKIPEVFSEPRSPTSQRNLSKIDLNNKQATAEDLGVEAIILTDGLQANATYISDISGSTGAEYTESESSEWSKSMASSLSDMNYTQTSTSGSHSVPFSNLHIGLQSVGTTSLAIESSEQEENVTHPLKTALKRKPPSPLRQQKASSMPSRSLFGTISDIGNVMLDAWKCQEEPQSQRKQEKRQDEEQLLERLENIRHY